MQFSVCSDMILHMTNCATHVQNLACKNISICTIFQIIYVWHKYDKQCLQLGDDDATYLECVRSEL